MKKKWVEPRILVQQFVANEYVAASCYRIYCQTPNNNAYYQVLIDDTNGDGKCDSGDQVLLNTTFHGCGKWHPDVIQDNPPTTNGFVANKKWVGVPLFGHYEYTDVKSVFWWSEDLGAEFDYHVMTPGNQYYETNPNAS